MSRDEGAPVAIGRRVHDLIAFAVFAVVIGHIGFALTHRDALRSMFRGWVTRRWARVHAPQWMKELEVE